MTSLMDDPLMAYASSSGPGQEQSLLQDFGHLESLMHSYQQRLKNKMKHNCKTFSEYFLPQIRGMTLLEDVHVITDYISNLCLGHHVSFH